MGLKSPSIYKFSFPLFSFLAVCSLKALGNLLCKDYIVGFAENILLVVFVPLSPSISRELIRWRLSFLASVCQGGAMGWVAGTLDSERFAKGNFYWRGLSGLRPRGVGEVEWGRRSSWPVMWWKPRPQLTTGSSGAGTVLQNCSGWRQGVGLLCPRVGVSLGQENKLLT